MILVNIFASIPNFLPSSRVSLTATIVVPKSMLLHTFATDPRPASPQCIMFFPIVNKIGLASDSNISALPPTIKVRDAASAPPTPPDTGASNDFPPKDSTSLCHFLEFIGSTVEESIHSFDLIRFFASIETLLTCSAVGSIVIITSLFSNKSGIDFAIKIPSFLEIS
eukprot:NODE_796_length_3843_cov_1.418269.p4 type:complete len:167 gc:universal NODE_796_length_3843_cov_1.418269:1788-1288(-)